LAVSLIQALIKTQVMTKRLRRVANLNTISDAAAVNGEKNVGANFPAVFKFKKLPLLCAALIIILVGDVLLGVLALADHRHDAGVGALVYLIFVFLLFGLLGSFAALQMSDILIDERGISRRLFGWKWQGLHWDSIQRIRAFVVRNMANSVRSKPFRQIQVFPLTGVEADRILLGKMVFDEQCTDLARLLELLNSFAARHSIRIEVEADGTWQPTSRL
jgi:hypothetical protein